MFFQHLSIFIEWRNKTFRHHNLHSFSIWGKVIGYPHCFVSSFSLKRHISLRRFASRHASITHLETFPRLHSTSYVWRRPNKIFLWCNLYLKLPYDTFRIMERFYSFKIKISYFCFIFNRWINICMHVAVYVFMYTSVYII